ncbi:serine hydrolase [candidate division KSB1 bacterium]|nr:serine hydrolase [candidate division KSB1 bacterium]
MFSNSQNQSQFSIHSATLLLIILLTFISAPLSENTCFAKTQSQAEELVFASWDQNLEQIKSLIPDSVDVNTQAGPGLTAYHCAKLRGNIDIQDWLLENGAKSDIKMPERNEIADFIFKRNADPDAPGGVLAIVRDGTVILKSCYGLANLEHAVPITSTTVFKLASVSKQFTAFAVCMLAQQGKISLDDDIHKYIPELYDFGYPIKIRHLLNHTAGFRDTMGSLCLAGWNLDDVITYDHLLTFALNQKGLNFEPGSEHLYSNTGYVLLAELVQRVTGETYRAWGETHILEPLQMTSSLIRDDYTELIPGKAYGYNNGRDGKFHAASDNYAMLGPSGFYSTIEDMTQWVINLETHEVGGQGVFDLMFQKGVLNNGEQISYASGLDITEHRGATNIGHGGGGAGFLTYIMYFPEHHFSAIVLYNYNTDVYRTMTDMADIYLGDQLTVREIKEPVEEAPQIHIAEELLDRYIGTYKVFPAFYITISRDGDQLMALETNKEICQIQAISETEFRLASWNQNLKFNVDESGDVAEFSFLGRTCPKVEEGPAPIMSSLSEDLTGSYYCEELDVRYTIAIEDGRLVAKHRRHGTANLTAAWKENFRSDWWFMRSVEFNRDEHGIVVGLTVNQWQSRNHRFVKVNN